MVKKNPCVLYHCTRLDRVRGILKEGLKTKVPVDRPEKEAGIYLSSNPFTWMWNATKEGKLKGAMLEVDVKGLSLKPDVHVDDVSGFWVPTGDYYCLEDIPSDRIRRVVVEVLPNCFQELSKNLV
jgi:hypothetical protein